MLKINECQCPIFCGGCFVVLTLTFCICYDAYRISHHTYKAKLLEIGMCIIYDCKRRCCSNYKHKVEEKRKRTREAEKEARRKERSTFPSLTNINDVRNFFLNEVELGEMMLGVGNDIDNGVIHMGNAVAMCERPEELLSVLKLTLAPYVYPQVVERFQYVQKLLKEDLSAK